MPHRPKHMPGTPPPPPVLVRREVWRTLLGMACPMLAGTFAMNAYHLTDTWFVSRLGTLPLAAMGFTFPVVMLVTCVAGGLGTGLTMLVSHAVGRHDHVGAARFTTHGILLMVGVTVTLSTIGCLSIGPVFRWLGVDAATLPLVGAYMRTWFAGALTMSLPMMGNGILISLGDARAASRLMIVGTLLNAVLDPIMIFGYLGCPALGIRGAALATVIAQTVSVTWLLLLLGRRHRLLVLSRDGLRHWPASWRRIVGMGAPGVLSMLLMPLSATVLTRLLGRFGNEAVAAAGAAGRIEMFAFVIPMALGISLTPFMSQNYGAQRLDRIREALRLSTRFALIYGGAVAVLFWLCAPWLARIFTRDPVVTATLVAYIRIIAFGYGMMEVHRYCGFTLNGLHLPLSATLINAVRVLVLLIPLSCLGVALGGVRGLFAARLVTDLVAGGLGLFWVWRALRRLETAPAPAGTAARPVAEASNLLSE